MFMFKQFMHGFATQLRALAADSVNVDCKLVKSQLRYLRRLQQALGVCDLQQDVLRGFKYLPATY